MTVHSFDGVLRQRRRLHTLQLWPGGPRIALMRVIQVRIIPYFVVAEILVMATCRLVPIASALGYLLSRAAGGNAYLSAYALVYVALPAAIAWLALNTEVDGRQPTRWLYTTARLPFAPRRTWCGRRVDDGPARCGGRVRVWWDAAAPRLHHGWIRGGRVTTTVPVRFTFSLRHRRRVIRPTDGYQVARDYEVDESIEVRP